MRKINDKELLAMHRAGELGKKIAEHFGVTPAAVSKRLRRLLPPPESLKALSEKEQKFAIERAKGKTQTQAALSSHDCTTLASAKSLGSQLMKKPEIEMAVSELLNYHGLTRSYRIGKLKTHVDSPDGHLSLKALDQSFRLDGAYLEEEVKAQLNYDTMRMTLRELRKERKRIEKDLGWDDFIDAEITDYPDDLPDSGE